MNLQRHIQIFDHGFVRYVDHHGSDQRIVEAARVSYHSPSKGLEADRKLIQYLWKNKHTSPFEMCKLTLNVKMPIFVMRQWVRHRMQNLNEVSARYTELPNEFYIPEVFRNQDTKNKQGSLPPRTLSSFEEKERQEWLQKIVKEQYDDSYTTYTKLLHCGVAREQARIVLPVGIYTEIYCCWDLKNLLHFITLREDSHAQAEIQEYAKAIKIILQHLFPFTMEAYESVKFPATEHP